MDKVFLVILTSLLWQTVSALFTVDVEQGSYQAQFQGNVTMGCRFQPQSGKEPADLTVIWQRISPGQTREVYRFENGKADLEAQDPWFRSRARLVLEELGEGRAKLEVTQLRINDSGTYQCQVEMGGADYKQIDLSVKAAYTTVKKTVKRLKEEGELELGCESEGYPLTSVTWMDGTFQELPSNLTSVRTPEQLFQVTSRLKVKSSDRNNYTCVFGVEGLRSTQSARFFIPDELLEPHSYSNHHVILIPCLLVVTVIFFSLWYYRRRKGLTPDTQEKGHLHEVCGVPVENPEEVLKASSSRSPAEEEVREHLAASCEDA